VLFNYNWLYAKMSALPLNEILGDFEVGWIRNFANFRKY
jgi:hypothetical protein